MANDNYSFRLISLSVGEKCEEYLSKNLERGKEYRFIQDNSAADFWGKGIHVSAIVGVNGSGKTAILDLMFRMINNLYAVLFRKESSVNIYYVRGIFAELHYDMNGYEHILYMADDEIAFNSAKYKYYYSLNGKIKYLNPVIKKYRTLKDKAAFGIKEPINNIADCFPFTIVSNYVYNSYLSTNYNENSSFFNGIQDDNWESAGPVQWLESVYELNNGNYFFPLMFVCDKPKGILNIESEEQENHYRIESVLLLLGKEIELIAGYRLDNITYSLDYDHLLFNGKRIVDNNELAKFKSLFDYCPNSACRIILRHLKINDTSSDFLPLYTVRYELLTCIFNVNFRDLKIKLQKLPSDLLFCEKLSEEEIKELIFRCDKLELDRSSSSFNYHRLKTFLYWFEEKGTKHPNLIKAEEYIQSLNKKLEFKHTQLGNSRLFDLSTMLPPHIFKPIINLKKIHTDETIEFSRLSSGEKQFAISVSTLLFHALNITPIEGVRPKYRNINLVFDEMELCFHPEYQRTFLSRFLDILAKLNLKNQTKYNILMVTHSPFILSDIPQSNIMYLSKGKMCNDEIKINPFAANVNEILSQSFFLENGFMGEFAQRKINKLLNYLKSEYLTQGNLNKETVLSDISKIGDPLLSEALLELYRKKFKKDSTQLLIDYYKKQIENLNKQ